MTYTYFAKRPSDGLVKIGKTANPVQRFKALRLSDKAVPICLLSGDLEKENHVRFSEHRVSGEWFSIPQNKLDTLPKFHGNLPGSHEVTVKISKEVHELLTLESKRTGKKVGFLASQFIIAHLKPKATKPKAKP